MEESNTIAGSFAHIMETVLYLDLYDNCPHSWLILQQWSVNAYGHDIADS